MKFFSSALVLSALQFVAAIPSSHLAKRATVNDVATLGYATLNGGTRGGSGGPVTTVTSLDALNDAVQGNDPKIVIISGVITGDDVVRIGSNTTVLGARGSALQGVGLRVLNEQNVIIRNVNISKVLASAGDAIGVQASHQVWIDHAELSSDRDHDKDFYDGLLDITHGVTGITVTNSKLYTHWKCSLIGHSDNNGAEDVAITVTMASNWWFNLNSRTPSFRFGHGHIFNNVFDDNNDGINTRDGAQLLVENNVWTGTDKPLYETDEGFAVARGNDFGGAENTAPVGTFTTAPYSYSLIATDDVRSAVTPGAGQTLDF
ncbi:pectate lyase [Dendrothele bispora CBS 962.96]|uniref:Pectate lyase n=1 Tax=Dendrothele bispora (strain CBS 962.96) TaxID=1314807 RepID=A0A4S8LIR2_DENBC|nr:pectate lyase [Dendrothele bispora CBS 962.96]